MGREKGKGTLQLEKNGVWTLRATINGVRVSKSTKTKDRAEAEKFLEDYMRPYVKGDNLASYHNILAAVATGDAKKELEADKLPQMKLSEAWAAYVASPMRRDLADTTLEGKRIAWQYFTKWLKENHREVVEVRQVKRPMVEEFLAKLKDGNAASTFNNRVCVYREIYRVLGDKARCKFNPFDGVKLMNDDSHARRELTVEELKRLSEAASRVGPEWRKLFAIGVYTGMRVGDCATLLWTEVDVVRSIILRVFRKTKRFAHGKPTMVPIHPALSKVFQETPVAERTGYVLPTIAEWYLKPGTGRPKVAYQLKKIFNAAGIVTSVEVEGRNHKAPEATFHSLRHTFVSLSANAGVPLHIVQSIVGHESEAMTRHYYHENETALRQAVAAIPAIGETGKVASPIVVENDAKKGELPFVPPAISVPLKAAIEAKPPVEAEVETPFEPVEVLPPVEKPEATVVDRQLGREATSAADPVVHERVGGRVAVPRTPKAQWVSDVMRLYGKRKATGVLEGTLALVKNGGYRFVQELYGRDPDMTPSEAVDLMEAYLYAKATA